MGGLKVILFNFMHEKARQRIEEFGKNKPEKKIKISIPKGDDVFENFKKAVDELCNQAIASNKTTKEQKEKAAFIKSRMLIV